MSAVQSMHVWACISCINPGWLYNRSWWPISVCGYYINCDDYTLSNHLCIVVCSWYAAVRCIVLESGLYLRIKSAPKKDNWRTSSRAMGLLVRSERYFFNKIETEHCAVHFALYGDHVRSPCWPLYTWAMLCQESWVLGFMWIVISSYVPSCQWCSPFDVSGFFQKENAPTHTSEIAQIWFEEQISPNLNLIDLQWDVLDKQFRSMEVPYHSLQGLKDLLLMSVC